VPARSEGEWEGARSLRLLPLRRPPPRRRLPPV
jgi:hypothetical protein